MAKEFSKEDSPRLSSWRMSALPDSGGNGLVASQWEFNPYDAGG